MKNKTPHSRDFSHESFTNEKNLSIVDIKEKVLSFTLSVIMVGMLLSTMYDILIMEHHTISSALIGISVSNALYLYRCSEQKKTNNQK